MIILVIITRFQFGDYVCSSSGAVAIIILVIITRFQFGDYVCSSSGAVKTNILYELIHVSSQETGFVANQLRWIALISHGLVGLPPF